MKRSIDSERRNPKRLCKKPSEKTSCTFGIFKDLPEEIMQYLLTHYLQPRQLTQLAICSKSLCEYIRCLAAESMLVIRPINTWIATKNFSRIKSQFREIGFLIRRTTSYLPTSEVLNMVEAFLYQLEKTYHRICEDLGLRFAYDCIGVLLYKVIQGWDNAQLRDAFILIEKLSRLKERVNKVMVFAPGYPKVRHYERDVRQFIQEVFLRKVISEEQHALWLTQIIQMYPSDNARLFYLLYGPLEAVDDRGATTGMIDWEMMCCCSSYHSGCPYSNFQELVNVLKLVFHSRLFMWGPSEQIEFIDAITHTPEKWCLENTSKLLYLLGRDVAVSYLQSKLGKNDFTEYSHIVYHLAQVSAELSAETMPLTMRWFVGVIMDTLKVSKGITRKRKVIREIFKAWNENITALTDVMDDALVEENIQDDIKTSFTNLGAIGELLFTMVLMADQQHVDKTAAPLVHEQ